MPCLPKNPTLSDFQQYIRGLENERGFSDDNVLQKCLLLGEEVGELFKAIRKSENIKIDHNSKFEPVEQEIADILIFLFSIANRYNIDLEQAFRDKEKINKKRVWKRFK